MQEAIEEGNLEKLKQIVQNESSILNVSLNV
jgi:hypothetical protein